MITHAFAVSHCRLLLFILPLLLIGCKGEVQSDNPPITKDTTATSYEAFDGNTTSRIDDYFDSLFNMNRFNGVALFAENGQMHTLVKGFRSFKTRENLCLEDQFQLASVSKPFTALAILTLVEKNLIDLDDSVSKFLVCTPYGDITIRQLLKHTSGIGYYAYVTDSIWGMPEHFMSNDDLITMMECDQIPRYFEPDRAFDYCNTNYTLLADIVEVVSGVPFEEYMKVHVFDPCGMQSSEIVNSFEKDATLYPVQGHYPNGKIKLPSYLDGVVGDKGMYSTVADLFAFVTCISTNDLISDSLWSEATKPQARYASNSYYGYGWRIKPMPDINDTLVYHNGWWRGFKSYFWMSKKTDKTAIILTNATRGGYLKQDEIWLMF